MSAEDITARTSTTSSREIKDISVTDSDEDSDIYWSLPVLLAEIENFSACLLALLVDGVADRLSESSDLEQALFLGTESAASRAKVLETVRLAEERLLALGALQKEKGGRLSVTAWGRAVYKTGFGPETCQRLREELDPMIRQSNEQHVWDWSKISQDGTPEDKLFKALFPLLELPLEAIKSNPQPIDASERHIRTQQDQVLLRGWLGGFIPDPHG